MKTLLRSHGMCSEPLQLVTASKLQPSLGRIVIQRAITTQSSCNCSPVATTAACALDRKTPRCLACSASPAVFHLRLNLNWLSDEVDALQLIETMCCISWLLVSRTTDQTFHRDATTECILSNNSSFFPFH